MKNEQKVAGLVSDLNRELEALLPLAAKAVGYNTDFRMNRERLELEPKIYSLCIESENVFCTAWDPIENDADAFKLAVDLNMDISFIKNFVSVSSSYFHELDAINPFVCNFDGDKRKSVRVAITKCAIEIGKRMSA